MWSPGPEVVRGGLYNWATDPGIERAIVERAHEQLGLITVEQLLLAGMSRRTIARRVDHRILVPVGRATLRVGAAPDT